MPAVLQARLSTASSANVQVERTDIHFFNPTWEQVAIRVEIHNTGVAPSRPGVAMIEAAPLGAFVPWQPLVSLPLPALLPGDTITLSTTARRPRVQSLGSPDRVPPRQLLIALGAEDPQDARQTPLGLLARLFSWRSPAPATTDLGDAVLPADLLELLGRANPHWAGNLNVFVNRVPVERHMAQALRVYPGMINLAMFVVGYGRDDYRFELAGNGAEWEAALYDMTDQSRLIPDLRNQDPVKAKRWIPVDCTRVMALALRPPSYAGEGSVEVHVEQRSSGKSAVVEFSLDPKAAGPGCYVVA